MNKLSGYRDFTLANGRHVELKFSNGATEIYGELMGLNTLEEIDQSLTVETTTSPAGVLMPAITVAYLKALRLYIYAAAKYAAIAQRKPVDFTEWDVAEWIEEIGTDELLRGADVGDESAKKNEIPTLTETT